MRFRRRIIRRLRVPLIGLVACAALAAPAAADPPADNYPQPSTAKIGDTPADFPGASRVPVAPLAKTGDTPADYPGMPGTPADSDLAGAAAADAREAGGFDWPSAAIGAAGAGLVIVVSLGGISLLSRRRLRVAR